MFSLEVGMNRASEMLELTNSPGLVAGMMRYRWRGHDPETAGQDGSVPAERERTTVGRRARCGTARHIRVADLGEGS